MPLTTTLDLADFRNHNVLRCNEKFHPCPDWSPLEWCGAIFGECGEVANAVKKVRRGDGSPNDVMIECADVITYCDLYDDAVTQSRPGTLCGLPRLPLGAHGPELKEYQHFLARLAEAVAELYSVTLIYFPAAGIAKRSRGEKVSRRALLTVVQCTAALAAYTMDRHNTQTLSEAVWTKFQIVSGRVGYEHSLANLRRE